MLAPTWRTHRRALMDVGESRRAVAWTQAAVEVAREGVDVGLERRAQDALPDEEVENPPPAIVRAAPIVGGVTPILDDEPEPGTGRLLAREPAAARDYDEAAGHLADGDVDLILVETRVGDRGSRVAVEAAARSGIPTWVAAIGGDPEGPDGPVTESALATWVETSIDAGAMGLLFPDGSAALAARMAEAMAVPTWGGLVGEVGDRAAESLDAGASTWLEAEARVVGLLRGARPERVAAIRATIDRRIQAELEREAAASQRWDAAVRRGASMAPGGAALWLRLRTSDRRRTLADRVRVDVRAGWRAAPPTRGPLPPRGGGARERCGPIGARGAPRCRRRHGRGRGHGEHR